MTFPNPEASFTTRKNNWRPFRDRQTEKYMFPDLSWNLGTATRNCTEHVERLLPWITVEVHGH